MLLLKFENVKVSYSKAPNVHVCLIVYGNTCQYLECYYGLADLLLAADYCEQYKVTKNNNF